MTCNGYSCQPCGQNAWGKGNATKGKGKYGMQNWQGWGAQGKGNGPTDGVGKGKAYGKGSVGARLPAWQCVHGENCRMAQEGTKNLGWRVHCLGCGRRKENAMEPAVARVMTEQVAPQGYQPVLSNRAKKKARNAQKRTDSQDVKEEVAPAPAAKAASKPQKHTPPTAEELGEAPKVSVPAFGITTMASMKDPRVAFEYPDQTKTSYTKTAAEAVAEHKVCADTSKLSGAKERLATYSKMIEDCEEAEKLDENLMKAANKLWKEATEEIAALSKATGGTAIECMKSKRQNMTLEESRRVEKALLDKQCLKGKMDTMKEQFSKQLAELNRRNALFDTIRLEVEAAWKADETARTNRFAEVVQAWETNIKEVSASQPVAEEAEMVEEESDEEEEEDSETAAKEADYVLVSPWSADDLPQLEKPSAEEYTYWLHLASHVSEWAQKGCAPCTYLDLIGPGEPQVLMESLVKLIGQPCWETLYANRFVKATDTVPRHLGFVLWNALMKPRELAEKELGQQAVQKAKAAGLTKVKAIITDATTAKEKKKNKGDKKGEVRKKK